jgi:hypothetical protein
VTEMERTGGPVAGENPFLLHQADYSRSSPPCNAGRGYATSHRRPVLPLPRANTRSMLLNSRARQRQHRLTMVPRPRPSSAVQPVATCPSNIPASLAGRTACPCPGRDLSDLSSSLHTLVALRRPEAGNTPAVAMYFVLTTHRVV